MHVRVITGGRAVALQQLMYWSRDDPTILAWELANEPRCNGDFSGSKLQAWVEHTAEFLKSIDPNHMVTVGSEGFFGSSTPGMPPALLLTSTMPASTAPLTTLQRNALPLRPDCGHPKPGRGGIHHAS
jgi:hypothetical protein